MNPRLIFLLSMTVVLFTIIGTLSHELGHALVAWRYGRDAKIHYGSTSYVATPEDSLFQDIALRNHAEIRAGSDFPERARFEALRRRIFREQRNITWGGPVQTMLTGAIGLILLRSQWRTFKSADRLVTAQWLIVFLSLFWLRQILNFALSIASFSVTGNYPITGDEARLALYQGLPVWSIATLTFLLATAVCTMVIIAVPKQQRPSLIAAFLVGAPTGYFLWFEVLGPAMMP